MAKSTFSAKTYTNRKEEKRLQVSGLQADFVKLAKGDNDLSEEFKRSIVEALKK